ncbi:hypothetical protein OIU78_017847 [Salix suchowensis]|nr:hypothetical protein OIU78_017847 [Salix suchowensis]
MATSLLSPCLGLPTKFKNLSINSSTCSTSTFSSLSFSSSLSHSIFNKGCLSMRTTQRSIHNFSIVCESTPNKKADSAEKRTRQAEKRRVYNKARKSEVKTRMKKVTLLLLMHFSFYVCVHGLCFLYFLHVKRACFQCYEVKCLFPECYEIEAM